MLSKLDWDMSAVIALDFVEHIIQRVRSLPLGWNSDVIRRHAETLVAMCSAHHTFYALAPSLIAAASVITTLRPLLEATEDQRLPSLEDALEVVGKIAQLEKVSSFPMQIVATLLMLLFLVQEAVKQCMDEIEATTKVSLASPCTTPTMMFATPKKTEHKEDEVTPTKVLDVARDHH